MHNNDRKIFFIHLVQLWKCFGSQSKLAKQVTNETHLGLKYLPTVAYLVSNLHSALTHTPVFEVKYENRTFSKRTC